MPLGLIHSSFVYLMNHPHLISQICSISKNIVKPFWGWYLLSLVLYIWCSWSFQLPLILITCSTSIIIYFCTQEQNITFMCYLKHTCASTHIGMWSDLLASGSPKLELLHHGISWNNDNMHLPRKPSWLSCSSPFPALTSVTSFIKLCINLELN